MKIEYITRKDPIHPIIGVARKTDSYVFVFQFLWLQIGVVKSV